MIGMRQVHLNLYMPHERGGRNEMKEILSLAQQTCVIIRSYKNDAIKKSITRALDSSFGLVMVVTRALEDEGRTECWIEEVLQSRQEDRDRVKLLSIGKSYSWSTALNAALKELKFINRRRKREGMWTYEYVFNCSVEAVYDKSQANYMLSCFIDPTVGVVAPQYRLMKHGNPVDMGIGYNHPRNTAMIVRRSVFDEIGDFDHRCDDHNGVEDLMFILEMMVFSDYRYVITDFQMKILVATWTVQEKKNVAEYEAMLWIVQTLRETYGQDSEAFTAVEQAIGDMNLDMLLKQGAILEQSPA